MSPVASAPTMFSSSTRPKCRARRPRRSCRGRCLLSLALRARSRCWQPPTCWSASMTRSRPPDEIERMSGLATLGIIPKFHRQDLGKRSLPIRARACRRPIARCARRCSSQPKAACPRRWSSPVRDHRKANRSPPGHRPTFRHHGAQGVAGRRRPAQSLAAHQARPRQLGRVQQLLDGGVHAARDLPDDADRATSPSWPPARCRPTPPICWPAPACFRCFRSGLEVFDFIVLDGPPVMGLADAPLLSSAAAATIFVDGRRPSAQGLRAGCAQAPGDGARHRRRRGADQVRPQGGRLRIRLRLWVRLWLRPAARRAGTFRPSAARTSRPG